MTATRYSKAFTTGALFFHESVKLVGLYVSLRRWDAVRKAVVAENLIQARTANTLKRVTNEITSRLATLSEQEINLLIEAEYEEQRYVLWLAVCRRYTFIGDFAMDVVQASFTSLKTTVTYDDYGFFFNKKAEWHNELDHIAPVTKLKVRQTLFKMMREAGILDKNNAIIPVMPNAALRKVLADLPQRERMFFPIADIVGRP